MAAARRLFAATAALSLATVFATTQGLAQGGPTAQPQAQEDRPRRRPPQAPPPSAAIPGSSVPSAGSRAKPAKPSAAAALKARLLAPSPLSSAVRSRYSQPATIARSTTGECRAQCAESRGECFNADSVDTSGCDPGWTRCLSTCSGLTYSRGP